MTQDYELHLFEKYGCEIIVFGEPRINCYFGNYSGYKMFNLIVSHDEIVVEDEIYGYYFELPDTREIFAYKDSKYYIIKKAYEAELISERDKRKKWKLYRFINSIQ